MASDGDEGTKATRRRFVIDTLGGLAGAVWSAGCGRADVGGADVGDLGPSRGGGPPETGEERDSGRSGTGGAPPHVVGDGGGTASGGAAGGAPPSLGGAPGSGGSGSGGGESVEAGVGGADAGTCALYPRETEGPFYLDLGLLRSDITEGKPGTPLELHITVVRAQGCVPIAGVAVDVWHCDAAGVYAGFPGQLGGLDTSGQKFLRGTQVTDQSGSVVFQTIYPGWYPGRTTHIHFKVHPTATTEVTSQLYFPEEITAAAYRASPYDTRGQKNTSNDADATAHTPDLPPLLVVSGNGVGYVGKIVIGVLE